MCSVASTTPSGGIVNHLTAIEATKHYAALSDHHAAMVPVSGVIALLLGHKRGLRLMEHAHTHAPTRWSRRSLLINMVLGTLLLSACDTVTISSTPTVPPTPGTLRWKVQTHASTGDYVGPPVVANGLLYVGLTGEVLAIDASSGTQRWQFPVRG